MSDVSSLEPVWVRRRWHAPRENGAVLAIPPLADMPATVARNCEAFANEQVDCLGQRLSELRQLAREEALAAARQYTDWLDAADFGRSTSRSSERSQNLRNEAAHPPHSARTDSTQLPLLVCGHQPELFHPGVWAKNFALHKLATATNGLALNLIVDNDAMTSTRIAVPVGSREQPLLEHIPFDVDAGAPPWEEACLRNEPLFRSFADRVSTALACWPIKPLLRSIWPAASALVTAAKTSAEVRLADVLTAARRAAERQAGIDNLELPISRLCQTKAFARFVVMLLSDVRRMHSTYNDVVETYRHVNHIRSSSHPVPNLAVGITGQAVESANEWLEVPLWVWRAGDSRRQRLYAKQTSTRVTLSDGREELLTLSLSPNGSAEHAVSQLCDLLSGDLFVKGLKLRPRALTTTLFARVFLADVFLHGLGGALYDEMTDRLIARLFGIVPPAYLTVTTTAHLPLASWETSADDVARLRHRLWDFDHNADRHMAVTDWPAAHRTEVESLLSEKRQLVAEQLGRDTLPAGSSARRTKAENFQRCRRLRIIHRRLAEIAASARSVLMTDLQAAESRVTANEVLRSREFAFCLFPENLGEQLRDSFRVE